MKPRVSESYLRKVAMRSRHDNYYHSAIVLKGGAIMSTGFNTATEHAEARALRTWGSIGGGTVITFMATKAGNIGSSNPCGACRNLMRDSGIETVIYWTPETGWVQERL
jgi:cytidine deaminase